MNAYLSIDLDYWCEECEPYSATRFFRRLFSKFDMPIMVAVHHHHLVHHINRTRGLDTVINVDYHSDLIDEPTDELTEANWPAFINFQDRGTFIWRYPRPSCLTTNTGYCHNDRNPFEHDSSNWAHTRMKQGLDRIPWASIRAVGVCLSPEWLLGNQCGVSYPIEALNLFDWAGRWWAYNGLSTSACSNLEVGAGIFRPRLTRPKCAV